MLLDKWFFLNLETSADGDDGAEGTEVEETESTEPEMGADQDLVPRSQLTRANREAQKRRQELKAAQDRIKELEDAEKSELERERDRARSLEQQLVTHSEQTRGLRAAVLAPTAGITIEAAADAARLLDWSRIEDPDSDEQVLEALKDLVKDKPYLAGNEVTGADGGRGLGSGTRTLTMNDMLRRASGRQ